MAIPKELTYANELTFTEKFIFPLLQRLGFSVVVNYHGQREFGKDLVFGEVDRFGHVVYHGMQVKYEDSISQNAIQDLIRDAEQAFNNPFQHPSKGDTARISAFYGVNGGSFGTNAAEHFYNSLQPKYGANVRLLDGKALLALDRTATMNRVESMGERLQGIILEIQTNRQIMDAQVRMIKDFMHSGGEFPCLRLRTVALGTYLEQPFLPTEIPYYEYPHKLWHELSAFNQITLSLDQPVSTEGFKEGRLRSIEKLASQIKPRMDTLEVLMMKIIANLGPLAQI